MEQAVVKILLLGICGYGSNYIVSIVGNQSDLLINDSLFHICTPASARNFLSDWIPCVRNTPSRNSA